jgi:glutathione S-transferase
MKLFSFWRSLATYRVRIALNLKGLSPEVIEVNLMKGHQREEAFRKVNPMMAIPALVDGDGAALYESLAIIEYLDETHPSPPLLPKDPLGRARVRGLSQIVACDSHPLIVPRVREYLAHEFKVDEAGVALASRCVGRARGASRQRKGNRHILPWRADHRCRHLRGQPGRRREFLQGRFGRVSDGVPHRRDMCEE